MSNTRTILVAEDDEHTRLLLKDLLESSGYQVILAQDGLEGIQKLEDELIDLLLVDIRLPYVSGIGMVKMAKQRRPGLPVICMNSYGSSPESIVEDECGAVVISKPFKTQELLGAISDLLK